MPKVYITNLGPHDYSEAEKFGELVYCTQGLVDKLDVAQMHRELSASMERSESTDFILLTSLTSLCAVACALFTWKHGQLHLLIHKGDGYIKRSLFFDKSNKETRHERSALTKP